MQVRSLNQNNIYQKPLSFNARICYVDKSTFYTMRKGLIGCFEVGDVGNSEWLIEEAAFKRPSAFTLEAYNCVVGSIFNPETQLVNMFHLSPYKKTMSRLNQVIEIIYEQAKSLKDKSEVKLEGLVTGGDGRKVGNNDDRKLLEAIKKAFENISKSQGMNYSVIAGRKNGQSHVNVISDAAKNTHYVYSYQPDFEISDVSELSKCHETAIICPNDELIIARNTAEQEIQEPTFFESIFPVGVNTFLTKFFSKT